MENRKNEKIKIKNMKYFEVNGECVMVYSKIGLGLCVCQPFESNPSQLKHISM